MMMLVSIQNGQKELTFEIDKFSEGDLFCFTLFVFLNNYQNTLIAYEILWIPRYFIIAQQISSLLLREI